MTATPSSQTMGPHMLFLMGHCLSLNLDGSSRRSLVFPPGSTETEWSSEKSEDRICRGRYTLMITWKILQPRSIPANVYYYYILLYIYISRTQMTLVLVGIPALFWQQKLPGGLFSARVGA